MPTTGTTPVTDESAAKGGGALRLVMVSVLSLSIAAAGYFIGGRGGGDAAATDVAADHVEEEVEPEIESILDLDAVNVNLTDDHYLRVAISLGLGHIEEESSSDGHGTEEVAEFPSAPAADLVLTTFAERSMAELSEPAGRSAARAELEAHLKEYYGDDVIVTIFITEFVMQ